MLQVQCWTYVMCVKSNHFVQNVYRMFFLCRVYMENGPRLMVPYFIVARDGTITKHLVQVTMC